MIKTMKLLAGFDPLVFLGITNFVEKDKQEVSVELITKISQYIFIRIVELLDNEDVNSADDPRKIFALAKTKIPNLDSKIKMFLDDFKEEFNRNLNLNKE